MMSERQWKRWDVIGRVNAEKLTMADAARICGISLRQLWRIRAAVSEAGKEALVHGNRGRLPANRTDEAVREKVIALRRTKYVRFNDAHFAEKLSSEEGVVVKLSGPPGAGAGEAPRLAWGEAPLAADVQADYLFGRPVTGPVMSRATWGCHGRRDE